MKKTFSFSARLIAMSLGLSLFFQGCDSSSDDDGGGGNTDPKQVLGVVLDGVTNEPVSGTVTITSTGGGSLNQTTTTNASGEYSFDNVASGTYVVTITSDDYQETSTEPIETSDAFTEDVFAAILPVTTDIDVPVASITGTIVDEDSKPIADVLISISATETELTNGFFASAYSNTKGQFYIGGIPITDYTGEEISSFKVRFLKDGLEVKVLKDQELSQNKSKVMSVKMKQASEASAVFSDDFETDKGWEMTGFWHRHAKNLNISNDAYPDFVTLGSGDETDGDVTDPYQGNFSMWYGEAETGNFLGVPYEDQPLMGGGESEVPNDGTITSPEINLTSKDEAAVAFWTWWEIESVNPNTSGYDLMEVYVIDEDEESHFIGSLNPYSDPLLEDRDALPYTSSGFNKAPIWTYQEFDISDYADGKIKIMISFSTVDELYNGFRGFMIDDFQVLNRAGADAGGRKRAPVKPTQSKSRK
ncbi:MAG TPA: carboxypeptidase-like regulatory domain-containing protein [Ohtaekwangia sp.]